MKSIIGFLLCSCIFVLLSCDKNVIPPEPEPEWDLTDYPIGEEFRYSSSFESIEFWPDKSDDWKQIAMDRTQFVLGEVETKSFDKYQRWPWSTEHLRYRQSYGTFPVMDGSTVMMPMAQEFVWQFMDFEGTFFGMRSFLNFSQTAAAYRNIIYNLEKTAMIAYQREINVLMDEYWFAQRPDIVLATHPSTAELNMAAEAGVELIIEPICFDSFVFITHKNNPVDGLTVEQIQDIYTGKITNWKEVGGRDEEIIAYQRPPNSGSQTGMEEFVMKGKTMIKPPTERIPVGMGMLVDAVVYYKNNTMSLGYTYKYYIDILYTHPDLKILKINGIMPSDDNIRNESYPFITQYFATIRAEDVNKVGGRFLNWILSDEGQASITQAGYVSLRDM
jgi:phosphate transport system substrate-binding protein